MKYSIIIPTYNHLEDCLKPCLESLIKYTKLEPFAIEIIIVANGCTDATKTYVESLIERYIWSYRAVEDLDDSGHVEHYFKLIWNPTALGYTKATNMGIRAAKGEYIVVLNNDTVLLEQPQNQWLDMLQEPFKASAKCGITGPLKGRSANVRKDFIIFFCAMVPKKLFGICGLLDEVFSPGYGEDIDFSIKVCAAGYDIVEVPQQALGTFPIYHTAEATVLDPACVVNWSDITKRNTEILAKRYALPTGWFYEEDIVEYRRLIESVPDGGTILELGCYKGRSLCSVSDIIIRKKLNVCVVDIFTGTETEKKEANYKEEFYNNCVQYGIATNIVKLMESKTEDAVSSFGDGTFDLVFIDTDHAYEAVKAEIKRWLPKVKKGGVISGHDYSTHADVSKAVHECLTNVTSYGSVWSHNHRKTILAYINTYNRYDTTLATALLSIITQTRKPDHITVFDDTPEPRDLRQVEHFQYLFTLMTQKGIVWDYVYAQKKGAHFSHEMANMAGYDMAWFIDDDCVAEPNCLEELEKQMVDGVGAVGGIVMHPGNGPLPPEAGNKIDDLYIPNIQWFKWVGPPREVEHIYSSFLYRCNIVHHDLRLSKKVFRGETMFTHSFFLKGYKLLVTPQALTWHFESKVGGCRSVEQEKSNKEMYEHDQYLFEKWLAFKKTGKKLYVLNGGLGDHYTFLQAITPEKGSVIACCYPDIFKDKGYEIISMAQAAELVDPKDYDIYRWCSRNNWEGHIVEAYRRLYENLN